MKRTVIGCLLATVAMYVWGAVFWMSPLPKKVILNPANDIEAGKSLLQHFPSTGTYSVPSMSGDQQTMEQRFKAGPIATVHIQREGSEMMPPRMMILGFVHDLVTIILIAWLLSKALPGLGGYCSRVTFVTVAGLAAGFFTNVGASIWMFVPGAFPLLNTGYVLSAWLVAGLVLAAFIKPKAVAPAQATQS